MPNERDEKQNQKDNEEDLRDRYSASGNAAEPQSRGDNCDNEKRNSPTQHDPSP
jgi:hypothetical protein